MGRPVKAQEQIVDPVQAEAEVNSFFTNEMQKKKTKKSDLLGSYPPQVTKKLLTSAKILERMVSLCWQQISIGKVFHECIFYVYFIPHICHKVHM